MVDVTEVLAHWHAGRSKNEIAASLGARYHTQRYTPSYLHSALPISRLPSGCPALVAFTAGFAAMVPFMDTSIIVGPASKAPDGAGLAHPVGSVVTAASYYTLLHLKQQRGKTSSPGRQMTPAGGRSRTGRKAAGSRPAARCVFSRASRTSLANKP